MKRENATQLLRNTLDQYNLKDWSIRLTAKEHGFLGLCSYKDKCIILNALHLDMHPDPEIINTIRHEVAHAIVGSNHGHDEIWVSKAREIGCTNTMPCSHLSLSPDIIDAIRSGADVQVEFEVETIHKPKYTINRIQDKCPVCNKVAKEKHSFEKDDKKYIVLECMHWIIKGIPKQTPFENFITTDANPNCKHIWDKNKCVNCPANRPYPFQVDGMRLAEKALAMGRGAGLFDEMGLGKTVQTHGIIKFHPEYCPVLYVVKSGIKFQWYMSILRWLGTDYLPQVIETGKDGVLPGLKSYIISYDLLRRFDSAKLKSLGIKTIVLDECQQVKNPDSTRTAEVRALIKDIPHVLPLSGTPWKNRGSEFFVALNMLDPVKFYSYKSFCDRWVDKYWDGNREKLGGIRDIARFREYTKDFIIRRERKEVMPELPLINRVKLYTQMSNEEQKAYDTEVDEFVKYYNSAVIGGEEDSFSTNQGILARMARMRHITGLAKIPTTVNEAEEFLEETDRKLVIFVHHKDVAGMLVNHINMLDIVRNEHIPVMSLTSDLSGEARYNLQQEFNNAPRAIMIASTLASGEGLNLQSCADCIMHERQWNPQNEEQAEGRFIRIGQTSQSVTAKYATARNSIDEQLDVIVETKRVQFHNAMNKGELATWNQDSIVKELAEALIKNRYAKKS